MCTTSLWVEIVVLLYHVCSAMIEPSIRVHIYESICHSANMSDCATLIENQQLEDRVQQLAANSIIYMKLIRSLPALLIILFCGAWSDNIGRKVPILFPFIGTLLSLALYLISYATPSNFSTILAGGLLSGVFGEVGLIMMAGCSFITDVTDKGNRTGRLSRLVAMSFFGQFIGSLIVAIMIQFVDCSRIFILAAVINAASIVVIITLLQDSLADKQRTVILCRMTYLVETWQVISKPRNGKNRLYIIVILVCMALYQASLWGEFDITMLYVRHRPLHWMSYQYGYYLTGGYLASGLGTLFLLPLLIRFFKVNDTNLAIVAVVFKVIQMLWQSFSVQTWMVYTALPMMIASSMFVPALKSMLSKLIDDDEIGKIFGLSAFGETLCGLFGSLIFTAIYGSSVGLFAGVAFIIQAVFNAGIFGVLFWLGRSIGESRPECLEDEGLAKDSFGGVGSGGDYMRYESEAGSKTNDQTEYKPSEPAQITAGTIPEHPAVAGTQGEESEEETDSEEEFALRTPKRSTSKLPTAVSSDKPPAAYGY